MYISHSLSGSLSHLLCHRLLLSVSLKYSVSFFHYVPPVYLLPYLHTHTYISNTHTHTHTLTHIHTHTITHTLTHTHTHTQHTYTHTHTHTHTHFLHFCCTLFPYSFLPAFLAFPLWHSSGCSRIHFQPCAVIGNVTHLIVKLTFPVAKIRRAWVIYFVHQIVQFIH